MALQKPRSGNRGFLVRAAPPEGCERHISYALEGTGTHVIVSLDTRPRQGLSAKPLRRLTGGVSAKLREANEKNVALRTRFDEVKEQRGKLQEHMSA